jgi:4-hydroxyphenylpyruvate dioxygenase
MNMAENPLDLDGFEFLEFSSFEPQKIHQVLVDLGFSKLKEHRTKEIHYYRQNDIHILLNGERESFGTKFAKEHGPCVSSMGWRVKNAAEAFKKAVARGAKPADQSDYTFKGAQIPAIYGVGDSLIYFVDSYNDAARYNAMDFVDLEKPELVPDKGFLIVDHLTNNVYNGTMGKWADFYKGIFGFTEVRYFDIKGKKTGLQSYALRSACGKFCIPINEASEAKSQINEYLEEYKGPGVQHIALATRNLLGSLQAMENSSIKMLDIDEDYYDSVFQRVPNVSEDQALIKKRNVLVDGDEEGYLLQIFTKNVVGPIFFELIQRKNHLAFGEGNFQALFKSIEKDQMKRGYLEE